MLDLVYVLATMLFFGVMLAYVAGCAALGDNPEQDRPEGK